MASLSAEELALLVEQTTESGSVAVAQLGEGSERRRAVYRWLKYQGESLVLYRALVLTIEAGEHQSLIPK